MTRQTLDGKHPDGWVPAQKITVEDALTAYSLRATKVRATVVGGRVVFER